MTATAAPVIIPEGVEFVEIAPDFGHGYRLESGHIYGSATHPYRPGSVVVKPADGHVFVYSALDDQMLAVKLLPEPKILTIQIKVTNEYEESKVRNAAPRWPGFVAITEE